MEAYRKDLALYDFTMIRNAMPLGIATIQFYNSSRNSVQLPVYPAYKNTIRVLEGEGVLFSAEAIAQHINSVRVVQDYWYDTEADLPEVLLRNSKWKQHETEPGHIEISKTYTDAGEIAQIIEASTLYDASVDAIWFDRGEAMAMSRIAGSLDLSADGKNADYDIDVGYSSNEYKIMIPSYLSRFSFNLEQE